MRTTIRRRGKTATICVRAETAAEKTALTDAVLSGRLIRELNSIEGLTVTSVKPEPEKCDRGES